MEIWKDVVGYEGIYEVSNDGQIRTKEGKITSNERYSKRVWKQRVLKQKVDKENSCRVNLWKNGKEKTWLVHRLVALAYIPTVEGKESINHIDGSRLNNHIDNLEWCNHKENNNHAFDTGLMSSNVPIVLVHKNTKQAHYFRSMAKAGKFLGKAHGYISAVLKGNQSNSSEYEIYSKLMS